MNKKEWQEKLKEMERLLDIVNGNIKTAEEQKEELEFNISNYKEKIKGL